jgi:ParB-like chromosome segregation protein Spo0J
MNVPITRSAKGVTVRLADIEIPSSTRICNLSAVVAIKLSIATIGLQSSPTCIERDGRYVLVAGRHRIEALKLLGVESVLVRLVDMDDLEARMWTISENLHRAELTVAEQSKQIAEFVKLSEEKRAAEKGGVQVGHHPTNIKGASGREAGISADARYLGVTRHEIRRAQTIAALPDSTFEASKALGLDDNAAALLAAARAEEPDEQVEALEAIAARGKVAAAPRAKPLYNFYNMSAGELSRWISITTPLDPWRVVKMLEETAAIHKDKILKGEK